MCSRGGSNEGRSNTFGRRGPGGPGVGGGSVWPVRCQRPWRRRRTIPHIVRGERLRPAARAWDFAAISMAVVAADEGCQRTGSADGWTRQIELTVACRRQQFLDRAGGAYRANAGLSYRRHLDAELCQWRPSAGTGQERRPAAGKSDLPSLGWLDSLIGAIDLVEAGPEAAIRQPGGKGRQTAATGLRAYYIARQPSLQMNHNARMPHTSERSQRARSMGFFGFGALAATSLKAYEAGGRVPLVIPENGYISVNVPSDAASSGFPEHADDASTFPCDAAAGIQRRRDCESTSLTRIS